MNLSKPNTYSIANAFALLLIGPPKGGKTSLALSFPKPAILDCDRNLGGAIKRGVDNFVYVDPHLNANTEKLLDNDKPFERSLKWRNCMRFMKLAITSPDVETIVIDGLSFINMFLQDYIIYNTKEDARGKLYIAGEQVMAEAYWIPFFNYMTRFITQACSCPKYLIVTCHEEIVMNSNNQVIAYRPQISGRLRNSLAGLFTDVWRCMSSVQGKKVKYTVRTSPQNLHQIGNSLNLPDAEYDVSDLTPAEIWEQKLKGFFS